MAPLNINNDTISGGKSFLTDQQSSMMVYGLTVAYFVGIFGFIAYKVRQQRKVQAAAAKRLDDGLLAAYPDAEERRKWLLKQELKADYMAAFPTFVQTEKKKTWIAKNMDTLTGMAYCGEFKDDDGKTL
jgi:hypothetical protein